MGGRENIYQKPLVGAASAPASQRQMRFRMEKKSIRVWWLGARDG